MRRTSLLAAGLALALAPLPAWADVTAHYAVGAETLSVEVDDGGDWRVELPGQFSVIRRAGVDYIAILQGKEVSVFKLDDLTAFVKPKLFDSPKGTDAFGAARFALTAGAEIEVAGHKGIRWHFGPETKDANGPGLDIAMSKDPALAPIGAVFRAIEQRVEVLAAGQFRPESNFLAMVRQLFESGTPLSAVPLIALRSVDTAAIDAKRFELPGPVLDRALLDMATQKHSEAVEATPAPPLP